MINVPPSALISMAIHSWFFVRRLGLIDSTLSNLQTIFGDLMCRLGSVKGGLIQRI